MWVVGGALAWLLVGTVLALVIGRAVRVADEHAAGAQRLSPDRPAGPSARTPARAPRRRVPLPPVGVGLATVAVALEALGYGVRLSGATGQTARLLSMDAPWSIPRLFVAALFAVAALAALAGAGRIPGRRTWWTAVGLIAAIVAVVKAGSTVHADTMTWLGDRITPIGAVVVSAALAVATLAVLALLSRAERRDRRRVLSTLALYAGAAVGLSGVSSAAAALAGGDSRWTAAATFVEESGEALTGVAVLVAVLIGVAPRLVLPAGWVLRRTADPYTLDLPAQLPGRLPDTLT